MLKNIYKANICYFHFDGEKEFVNKAFTDFLSANGIFHRLSCPYMPQQNGIAERKNRYIANAICTLLFDLLCQCGFRLKSYTMLYFF